MLKLIITLIPMSLLVGANLLCAAEYEPATNDLEPCMNGEVSASGAFPSEAAERQFLAEVEQEPCMNGDLPPDGVLAKYRSDEIVEHVKTAGTP